MSKDTAQYSRQLRDHVKSLLDNFNEILTISTVNEEEQGVMPAQVEHKAGEIKVRAANMVRAAEALSKLVTDIQEFLILNDFSSINTSISQQTSDLESLIQERREEMLQLYKCLQTESDSSMDTR